MKKTLKCLLLSLLLAVPAGAALAQEPKVLTYPRTQQFETLDPQRQFDEVSTILVEMVYDKLIGYSYLERPLKLEPRLLEKMPELGPDKVTYTFTLRKGVRFHDNPCFKDGKGRELVADDVLYSLKRYADARVNNKSWFAMEGAVVGLDEFRAATAKLADGADYGKLEVAGLKKIDNQHFSIKLTKPNPLFLFALAMSSTAVVPVEAVQKYKEQFSVNPVGTGPFTLKDAERKGVLRFLKNPGYFGTYPTVGAPGDKEKGLLKDAGRKLPLVDVVEMPLIEEAQPAALKFLKGELDWRGLDRANFSKLVQSSGETFTLRDEYAGKFEIYWVAGLDTTFTIINQKDALLGKNKALRQALAHLIDSKGHTTVLLNGRGRKLNSLIPLDLPGSERDTGASGYRDFDVAAAKKLLAEAGYPDGKGLPPISLAFPATDADTRNVFDFYKGRAAQAGVQLVPALTDTPTFIKNLSAGNFQLAYYGWVADYADAEDFYQLLYSKNVAPGPNYGSFTNAAYDKAYETSRYMANGPERYAQFRIMNDILRDEVPLVLGYNPLRFGIHQKWISNFKRNVLVPEFAYIDVDMAKKKKGL